jgi:OOP family OmpA-OmpF porin
MNSNAISKLLVAAAATLLPLCAAAQAYLGASAGTSDNREFCSNGSNVSASTCKKNGTAWRVFAGYFFTPNIGVEAGYVDLGKATAGDPGAQTKAESNAADLQAVFAYRSGKAALMGRAGAYYARTEVSSDLGPSARKSNGGLTFGFGMQYDFLRSLGVRGDFQHYHQVGSGDIGGTSDINVFMIGVVWTLR